MWDLMLGQQIKSQNMKFCNITKAKNSQHKRRRIFEFLEWHAAPIIWICLPCDTELFNKFKISEEPLQWGGVSFFRVYLIGCVVQWAVKHNRCIARKVVWLEVPLYKKNKKFNRGYDMIPQSNYFIFIISILE